MKWTYTIELLSVWKFGRCVIYLARSNAGQIPPLSNINKNVTNNAQSHCRYNRIIFPRVWVNEKKNEYSNTQPHVMIFNYNQRTIFNGCNNLPSQNSQLEVVVSFSFIQSACEQQIIMCKPSPCTWSNDAGNFKGPVSLIDYRTRGNSDWFWG